MFLTCAPASTATGFAIAPDISINFMGAGDREVWMNSIFPSLIFQPHLNSSGTSLLAQPFQSWGCMTMYSLTAYLFTKSHIAECIKNFIWLPIIGSNNKKNHRGHSILLLLLLTASLAPATLLLMLSKSLASQALSLLMLAASLAPPALIFML